MRSKREIVPVYLVMGFLESGKTTLINSMLEDQGFSDGIRTLIISCEEGMEEYDGDLMNEAHAAYVQLEEKEEFTTRKLIELDEKYPEYGFAQHKGYGTAQHIEALKKYGPCPIHRRSFEPVRSIAYDFDV